MKTLSLSDLVEINPRVNLQKGQKYSFVEMGEVEPGRRYVQSNQKRIFKNGGAKFLSGDTLFARITPCLENGKICQYKNKGTKKAFGSTEFFVLRARPGISDPGFVYYLANSEIIRRPAEKSMSGASGRQRAGLESIINLSIPAYSLFEQQKTASILSAYDDLIENNLRRIKILEEMAQNLYREWFVKFRFPGHKDVRFVDSPLGKIPEGWEIIPLAQLSDHIRNTIKLDSIAPETPYFGLEHLPRKSITLSDWGYSREIKSTKLLFERGDILFGKIRPYFHKVGVAPIKGICSSDTIIIRPKKLKWFSLVLGCTSSIEFVEHATATSQGTKMPRANWDVLSKYLIPVPPFSILNEFNVFMTGILKKLHNFIFINQNLRQTRELLLPKLISGDIDVSKLDIETTEEVEE